MPFAMIRNDEDMSDNVAGIVSSQHLHGDGVLFKSAAPIVPDLTEEVGA
jgi:hypothetical protein